jgi:hypothetical protein
VPHEEAKLKNNVVTRPQCFVARTSDQVIRRRYRNCEIEAWERFNESVDEGTSGEKEVFIPENLLGIFFKLASDGTREVESLA